MKGNQKSSALSLLFVCDVFKNFASVILLVGPTYFQSPGYDVGNLQVKVFFQLDFSDNPLNLLLFPYLRSFILDFSNSLIIHQFRTKEITTVKEVWIPGLN